MAPQRNETILNRYKISYHLLTFAYGFEIMLRNIVIL